MQRCDFRVIGICTMGEYLFSIALSETSLSENVIRSDVYCHIRWAAKHLHTCQRGVQLHQSRLQSLPHALRHWFSPSAGAAGKVMLCGCMRWVHPVMEHDTIWDMTRGIRGGNAIASLSSTTEKLM